MNIKAIREGEKIIISFPFSAENVRRVKELDSRRYDPERKIWWTGIENLYHVISKIGDITELSDDLKTLQEQHKNKISIDAQAEYLRPYQKEGVEFLLRHKRVLLGDDPGLGKTPQTIAAITQLNIRALIVCPKSVKSEWARMLKQFAPDTKFTIINGSAKKREFLWLDSIDQIVICNYEQIRIDQKYIDPKKFELLVLDEVTECKNYKAQITKLIINLSRSFEYVIALSGTPLMNHPSELWQIFNIVQPFLLGDFYIFKKRYLDEEFKLKSKQAKHDLHIAISRLMLRRKKSEVEKDLPPKIYLNYDIELSDDQFEMYKECLSGIITKTNEEQLSTIAVLAMLTRLKQICNHPRLIDPDSAFGSEKFEHALKMIDDILDNEEQKLVVFSQYSKMIDLFLERTEQYKPLVISGDINSRDREKAIYSFQNDSSSRLLFLTTAGDMGITLNAATDMILFDETWNPAQMRQIEDRIHGRGEKRSVNIHRLITKNTIEEKIKYRLRQKQQIISEVVDGEDLEKMKPVELMQILREGGEA